MSRHIDHRRKSIDEILAKLQDVLSFPDSIRTPMIENYKLQGEFRRKVEGVLKRNHKQSSVTFDEILWRKCEVGHYTGNQLLRGLVAICRDEELFEDGTGVVLTVNGEVHMAMFFDVDKHVICSFPSVKRNDKKQYFDKIFDENWCELNKDSLYHQSYCTDEKLQEIRDPVPQLLTKFLNEQIVETNLEYRRAFTGLLEDIVNCCMQGKRHRGIITPIPLEACIWLAVNHSL